MLTSLVNKTPPTKFVLIEDTVEVQAGPILKSLVKNHLKTNDTYPIHFLATEGTPKRIAEEYNSERDSINNGTSRLVIHDCLLDPNEFEHVLSTKIEDRSVVVINSLAHLIYNIPPNKLMKLLNSLKQREVLQTITVLHHDVLEDPMGICPFYRYLATLSLELLFVSKGSKPRVLFTYKKSSGKVIRQYEEYSFPSGQFTSESLKKLDPKLLVQESLNNILPDNMTTFKISLEDKEKEDRDKLVLPYLPKEESESNAAGGEVFYQLEEADDWDPEDPDDDLDF